MELRQITWADFSTNGMPFGQQEKYGDFNGTILDLLKDERIPSKDRLCGLLIPKGLNDRTIRRIACKCVRSTPLGDERVTWDLLMDDRSRHAVEVAERYANGMEGKKNLRLACSVAAEAVLDATYAKHEAIYKNQNIEKKMVLEVWRAIGEEKQKAYIKMVSHWMLFSEMEIIESAAYEAFLKEKDHKISQELWNLNVESCELIRKAEKNEFAASAAMVTCGPTPDKDGKKWDELHINKFMVISPEGAPWMASASAVDIASASEAQVQFAIQLIEGAAK